MPTPPPNRSKAAVATFFGVVLPTLVAGADAGKPLSRDEAIDQCVKWRERALPCKQEMADIMMERVPPERRAAAREKFLKEMEEGGRAPLDVRKAKCAAELDRKGWLALMTRADWAGIETCFAEEKTCKAALACGRVIIFRQR